MFRASLVLVALLWGTISAVAVDAGKVAPTAAFSDDSAPAAIVQALEPAGNRLTLSDGSTIEVWLRKSIPVAKQQNVGATYPSLETSTLLGVIKLDRQASDFRGQPIKPGTYTMRYELLPTDENHVGLAPKPDFVLLVPIAVDPGPDAMPTFGELVELSAKASGTPHPAVFKMAPVKTGIAYPSLFYSGKFLAFGVEVNTASGKIPLAIVVRGVAVD